MSDRRVRVCAELYRHALADAIDWVDSYLASHEPNLAEGVIGHCKPGARCEDYQREAGLLRRYKRAYAALVGPQVPVREHPRYDCRDCGGDLRYHDIDEEN